MVEKQDKARRKLSRYDHEEIRFLRFRGLTIAAIARRMSTSVAAVRYRVSAYELDNPVGQIEAVRLELLAAFRETSRRLEQGDVSDAEHTRLSGAQVKQALALARVLPDERDTGEDIMANSEQGNMSSLDKMNDEDMRNEVRRLVGLETKGVAGRSSGCTDARRDEPLAEHAVSASCDGGAKTADTG